MNKLPIYVNKKGKVVYALVPTCAVNNCHEPVYEQTNARYCFDCYQSVVAE